MPLGDEKRLERRRRILQASRDLLGEVGYAHVTMKGLADAAGVTAPTLYNTFGSKDELLYEAVLEDYGSMLEEAGPASGVRGLERLIGVLEAAAQSMMLRPDYAKTLMESFRTRQSARPLGRALRLEGLQALVEAVEEMRSDGELEEWADPALLAMQISSTRRGVARDWLAAIIAPHELADMTIASACLILAGATSEETSARCRKLARERHARLSASAELAAEAAGGGR